MSLVEVRDYALAFEGFDGVNRVLDGIDLEVQKGESLGIVGETGCGKSMLVKSLIRLVDMPPGRVLSGRVAVDGIDVLQASDQELAYLRRRSVSMVFQDPTSFLNPLFSIAAQLGDVIAARAPEVTDRASEAVRLLTSVGLPDAEAALMRYPHELSGGMRQRVLIAMALAGSPKLLVADEPTTALDVTVQGQILRLIAELVATRGLTLILVSHDLGVIGAMCRRVVVMYAGTIVEDAPAAAIFAKPLHPYAQGLIAATPDLAQPDRVMRAMAGMLPDLRDPPAGCRFAARCPIAIARCRAERPALRPVGGERKVACHLAEDA
jgi:oligopeptide/dipeptide ABC transporter ATP-binding protein